MMNDDKKMKKRQIIILFVALAVILVIVIVGIGNLTHWFGIENYPGKVVEKTDPISGELLLEVNQEPEGGKHVAIVGLGEIIEQGFSPSQQDVLYGSMNSFFNSGAFSFDYVSYKKDSFTSNDDYSIFTVLMESNTGDKFLVTLDTGGSYFDLKVSFSRQ